jgi:hypothetical protein
MERIDELGSRVVSTHLFLADFTLFHCELLQLILGLVHLATNSLNPDDGERRDGASWDDFKKMPNSQDTKEMRP